MQLVIKQTIASVTAEVMGVEMGVLGDGTPFLTGRGLATICGTAPSTIIEHARTWREGQREGRFHRFMVERGTNMDSLFIPTLLNNRPVHAYSDSVSMLVLEYYAFEANNVVALRSYRALARQTLRDFIYLRTGYAASKIPAAWQKFHDRLVLNVVPRGYFSIFREMSDVIVASIRAGLIVDEHIIPDISVGKLWGVHWNDQNLEARYGARIKYEHEYPAYFPQAAANPQHPWAYPDESLAEFRRWMMDTYLPHRYPVYLERQVGQGKIAEGTAQHVLKAVGQPALAPAKGRLPPPVKGRLPPAKKR
jgi:hypothetical protein